MLRALGIYKQDELEEKKVLIKVQSAQKDKSVFFQDNQLAHIDDILLKSLFYSEMVPNKFYMEVFNDEYHYLYYSSIRHAVFAMVSKTALDPTEKSFLLKNMEHILIRPDTVKKTLDDIIANPFAFTGRDLLISGIQEKDKEVIKLLQDNIDQVLVRGVQIEDTLKTTIKLKEDAKRIEMKAKELNSCCSYF